MSTIDERLRDLNIALPDVLPTVVDGYVPAFAPFVQFGDQIQLSGRLGKKDGKPLCGKVGENISLEEGKVAARGVAIELLAVLKAAVGDLNNVRRVVKNFCHGQWCAELHRTTLRCRRCIRATCSSVRGAGHPCPQCNQCGAGAIRRVRRN